tara:strand:+ start:599 stop:1552 length:954 start_codon:yes stop_codon:yes gene_type:complete
MSEEINLKKLSPTQRKQIAALAIPEGDLAQTGINCNDFVEPVPVYDKAKCEVVYSNDSNAWIVLGRDRPAGVAGPGGYGPRGHTGAGSVDIVVGRMAGATGGPDSNIVTTPNFFTDAARIHISQKSDVDSNFGLVGDTQLIGKSSVGIKADGIRLVGREGIKIVTGKAKNLEGAGQGGEKNSRGDKIELIPGIDLIAGNDVEAYPLEAIVKAEALAEALTSLVERLNDLTDIVNENAKIQTQINNAVAKHTHAFAGPGAVLVPPDLAVTVSVKEASKLSSVHQNLYKQKMNAKLGFVETYLKPTGKKWIGSRFNKTN